MRCCPVSLSVGQDCPRGWVGPAVTDLDEGRGGAVVGTTEGTQDGLPHEWSGRRRAPVEDLPWCTPHHP